MPLTKKGQKIKKALTKTYGKKKGEKVLYAMENKKNNLSYGSKKKKR